MKPETIERCIYWQQHVIQHSRDPVQQARCRRAIEQLTRQLQQARTP
jgi:hypothetical protein